MVGGSLGSPQIYLTNGRLRTEGYPNIAGGIYREFPLTLPVSFDFDFSTPLQNSDDNCSVSHGTWQGGWAIVLNAAAESTIPESQPAQIKFLQYRGSDGISRGYYTTNGPVYDGAQATSGARNFRGTSWAHIKGVVGADLSAIIHISYRDGLLPDTVSICFPPPTNAVLAPPGGFLFLGNSSCIQGDYYFDNFELHSVSGPPNRVSDPQVTIELLTPEDLAAYPQGSSALVTGIAASTGGCANENSIRSVYVNGRPVDVLDATGNFFTRVNVAPGRNNYSFTATDAFGQTSSASLTLFGFEPTTNRIDFSIVSDVSASFLGDYAQTSFNERTRTLYADLFIRNTGQYPVKAPLVIGIAHISDPSVRLLNADGLSPDSIPYFDFTTTVINGTLNPQQSTLNRSLAFYNPNKVQFTYDLVVLGVLNRAPVITSVPVVDAVAGRPYAYAVQATDPDGDTLTFSLPIGPTNMAINAATGLISWSPAERDVGSRDIRVRVEDGHGGYAEQRYVLSVTTPPPNRPPYFVSVPVVDAFVNMPYVYTASAVDPDDDPLTFDLVTGASGMILVDSQPPTPNSQLVEWIPTSAQMGTNSVTLRVSDGRGGTATQAYIVTVLPDPSNHPPVIISQPVTNALIGQTYTYDVDAIDPDNDILTYSLVTGPACMTVDPVTGLTTWLFPALKTDFNSGLGGWTNNGMTFQISGAGELTSVAGLAGRGIAGNVFSGNLLRNDTGTYGTAPGQKTVLTLMGLPQHTNVSIRFLLAIIDSWDGSARYPASPDYFNVAVGDGGGTTTKIFTDTFDTEYGFNGGDAGFADTQNYPRGANQIIGPTNLNLGSSYLDEAYDMGMEPRFQNIAHTSSTLVVEFWADGGGWQGGNDESWGIDNLEVVLGGMSQVPVTVCVDDGHGGFDTQSFVVDVQPPTNHPPVIISQPVTNALPGQAYTYPVRAIDTDNDPLTYSLVSAPTGMMIDTNTGLLAWQAPCMPPSSFTLLGTRDVLPHGIAVDPLGNVIMCGLTLPENGVVTNNFDPCGTNGVFTDGPEWTGIAVAEYSRSGSLLWVRHISGEANTESGAYDVKTDRSGNVYVTGLYQGTPDFDPGPGVHYAVPSVAPGIYILKLDPNGNFVWVATLPNATLVCSGWGLALDNSGNVYCTGQFVGTVDFDPGPGVFNLSAPSGSVNNAFLWKLNAAGQFVWARKIGDSTDSRGCSVAVDSSGNPCVAGFFAGTVVFDPGSGGSTLTADGRDPFVAKFTSSGDFLWAHRLGALDQTDTQLTGEGTTSRLCVGPDDNVYVTGNFSGDLHFDSDLTPPVLSTTGQMKVFLAKLTGDGDFVWAKLTGAEIETLA